MKDFKEIAKEMRTQLEQAICVGPAASLDERVKRLLDEFEASVCSYADDEAVRRAKLYVVDQMNKEDSGGEAQD